MNRENQALSAPMLGTQLHTQRCLCRSQECSWEMRFTRGLLQSIDLSMWSCLPLCLWAPGSAPAPWKQPLRKDLQEPLFPEAGKWSSQEAGKASLLRARSSSQPAWIWKSLFGRNGLASPKGDLQICSEDGNSRGRVEVPDCPLPALKTHS